jgi:hypothetical protein
MRRKNCKGEPGDYGHPSTFSSRLPAVHLTPLLPVNFLFSAVLFSDAFFDSVVTDVACCFSLSRTDVIQIPPSPFFQRIVYCFCHSRFTPLPFHHCCTCRLSLRFPILLRGHFRLARPFDLDPLYSTAHGQASSRQYLPFLLKLLTDWNRDRHPVVFLWGWLTFTVRFL